MRKEIIPAYSISSFRLFAGFSTGMEFAGEERYRYGSMVSMNYIFKKRNKTGGITIAPRTDWTVYGGSVFPEPRVRGNLSLPISFRYRSAYMHGKAYFDILEREDWKHWEVDLESYSVGLGVKKRESFGLLLMTYYILKRLKEDGVLLKEPSPEDAYALAEFYAKKEMYRSKYLFWEKHFYADLESLLVSLNLVERLSPYEIFRIRELEGIACFYERSRHLPSFHHETGTEISLTVWHSIIYTKRGMFPDRGITFFLSWSRPLGKFSYIRFTGKYDTGYERLEGSLFCKRWLNERSTVTLRVSVKADSLRFPLIIGASGRFGFYIHESGWLKVEVRYVDYPPLYNSCLEGEISYSRLLVF